MSYESKVIGFLQTGYNKFTSTDEQTTVAKALRSLRINTKMYSGFIVGDSLFQKRMFDTAALAGLTITTTAATATSVVESFDANTFVKSASSTNYTVDTTGKIIKATSAASACTIVSNNYTVTQSATAGNYVVLKIGTPTATTGTAKYSVSRDGGTTWTRVYPGASVFIGNQPTGTNFCFKVEITGDYQLAGGIGFSLR